jgi:peptide/nickel transport system substrate-binding protein
MSKKGKKLTRRNFLKTAGAVTGYAALQACGADATATPVPPAATSTPAATAAPPTPTIKPTAIPTEAPAAAGGDISIRWNKPNIISPLYSTAGEEQQVNRLVLGSIYKMSDTLEAVPDLGERWEVSPDSTVFTYYLREGVEWSDGEPWTAQDVVFTLERSLDPRTGSIRRGRLVNIKGAEEYEGGPEGIPGLEALDDYTVRITLTQPDAAFITQMGMFAGLTILPKHILKDVPPEQMKEHEFSMAPTVGAGAYNFIKYETDQFAELHANDNFYHGRPAVDRIFLKILTPDVGVAQLERGELDLMVLPVDEADRLKSDPNVNVISKRSVSISQIGINNERPFFQDKRVRQAMMYAIDRQGIIDSIMFGEAEIINSPVIGPPWVGEPEVNPYPFDPDKARQLLQDAGWDPDQKVDMIYTAGNKEQDAYGPVIQQQLRDVGMQVDLVLVEVAELIRRYIDETDFDLFLFGGGQYRAEPSLTGIYYHSKNLTPAGGNGTHYVNPEIDELLDAGVATSDLEERKAVYHEIARIINEDVPTVFLWSPNVVYGTSKRLKGFLPPSYATIYLWNAEDWSVEG